MSPILVKEETIEKTDSVYTLVESGQQKLRSFIMQHYPDLNLDSVAIQQKISELKKTKKTTAENLLNLLDDLNKLNLLQKMNVDGKTYYTLAESAGGATEKVSLVDEATVSEKLKKLTDTVLSIESYHEARKTFKLSTNAFLKLPKHGKVTEVQRESMALAISRIIGLTTTKSTDVMYNGNPAIFIPFDKITELSQFATGKTMQGFDPKKLKKVTYSHYSTLNPVGEGLQTNSVIDDLGKSIGLFYLCSDTDAVGGYNQNKALKANSLFVFDQVFSLDDKLGLDSRLSMQPTKWLTKHTRHDQGRNRTVIEDASIDTKYNALMQLKEKKSELDEYCAQIISEHKKTLSTLQQMKRKGKNVKNEINLTKKLLNDAQKVLKKLDQRIDKIDTIFPKIKGNIANSKSLLKPTLILEKLLNKPVLFASDGRPYRNPWTQRNSLRATNMSEDADPNYVRIRFNKSVPLDMLELLRQKTGHDDSPTRSWFKTVRILKSDLIKLQENVYFPEHGKDFEPNSKTINYLDIAELDLIKQGYGAGGRGDIIKIVKAFDELYTLKSSLGSKLILIEAMEQELNSLKNQATEKGFGQHVIKKFHMDVQQKLQALMKDEQKPKNITEAFSAALKLDQISIFNHVVNKAIGQGKLQDPAFTDFLEACIAQANNVTDHASAINNSHAIKELSLSTITALKKVDPQVTIDYRLKLQASKEPFEVTDGKRPTPPHPE